MAKVKILTAAEAANLVEDGMTVSTNGFVACDLPEELTSALEKRFLETGSPKNLTYFYAAAGINKFFKLSRIGMPEQMITKEVTRGARIKALICLKANKPNKMIAMTNTKICIFI